MSDHPMRRRRRRFDDDRFDDDRFDDDIESDDPAPFRRGGSEPGSATRHGSPPPARLDGRAAGSDDPDGPPEGDRWSTWPDAAAGERGPRPYPPWLVIDAAAVDRELGVLKTGKEADVHLIERGVPGTTGVLLAAKRYRGAEHRMFHRDAGYLEGRQVRRSRETRAMANRTRFGREVVSAQWAGAELHMEFLGEPDGSAAPRLAQLRPDPDTLCDLWHQLGEALGGLAEHGLAHGDLSAYNLLVHRGRLVLIDLPQVVDVVSEPAGTRVPGPRRPPGRRVVPREGTPGRRRWTGGAARRAAGTGRTGPVGHRDRGAGR